ncbi:MAG: hypothetical protein H7A32_02915 [Deltaproteobacteria bacterium]|nr:hypothetical protein [Deltaproteobacteria bacterium]
MESKYKSILNQLTKKLASLFVLFSIAFIYSCDSDPTEKIAIEINPLCVELLPGENQQFNASIFINGILQEPNPDNNAVTWSVEGGNINGTVSNNAENAGFYQSPEVENLPDEVVISATSKDDSQKRAQASILFTGNCP